ncbi:MAG: hypothetical protein K8I30_07015, partial [Anaerolineae bacterium]|nr:hypothetical protein [Anaerolineae bacterium]
MNQSPVTSFQSSVKGKAHSRLGVFVALYYAVVVFFFAACIPAKVPSNLDDTPGPAVVVSDKVFENSAFTARYPDGW